MTIKHVMLMGAMGLSLCGQMAAQDVKFGIDHTTGAIKSLRIAGDSHAMDWLLQTDGSQYQWVTPHYGWGLGYATINGNKTTWEKPGKISADGMKVSYDLGDVLLEVSRKVAGKALTERYTFKNKSDKAVSFKEAGIYTPWNDNYPDAATCMTNRCNTHIWPGGDAAYVLAERMGGQGEAVGLVATEGRLTDYDVWERGNDKGWSNFRGVFALCPPDTTLQAGESMTIAWRIFKYKGREAFFDNVRKYGGAVATSDRYIYEVGDTAHIALATTGKTLKTDVVVNRTGEMCVEVPFGKNRSTRVTLYGVSSYEGLIAKRVNFILDHQQMNDPKDPRYGAYMVYDNNLRSLYLNDDWRQSPDTDEGRERVGMGVLLADWYVNHPSDRLLGSLTRYATFLRTKLQTADYTTYSTVDLKSHNRGYNYPWVGKFYFKMYNLTHNRQYALDGYRTMRAFFRHFNYGFYAIYIPVADGIKTLDAAGLTAERDTLLADYKRSAAVFMKNGLNFPHHEVNYEQSIVAPAAQFLLELYEVTKDTQYLRGAEVLMPALEAFDGPQPHYRLNNIGIRHWDGFWFGRRQTYGDTFPHYWSVLSGNVYHLYAQLANRPDYQLRAEQNVRNNLCSFEEDGTATCAYVFPRMVNGEAAHYADVLANDQDWALVAYLFVNGL